MKRVKKSNDELQAGNAESLLNEKELPTPESGPNSVEIMKSLLKIELSKPSVEDEGDIVWRLPNGDIHRDYGPAVEYANVYKVWYKNGKLHREDGPAIIRTDGTKSYYLNDIELSESKFNARTKK